MAVSSTNAPLMEVNVVASDRPVWRGKARSVTIPASEGGMGILPGHEPVLTVIKDGVCTIVEADGTRQSLHVAEGFISFDSNKLTVAVERASDLTEVGAGGSDD